MQKTYTILSQYEELKRKRVPYEYIWDEINALVMPNRESFFSQDPDTVTSPDLYDTTGVQSAEYLASTLINGLVNPQTKWFNVLADKKEKRKLGSLDVEVMEKGVSALALIREERADMMYDLFNSPESGFYPAITETTLDLVTYGTAVLEIEYDIEKGVIFKSIHLAGIFLATDKAGQVDTIFNRFYYTARQAAQKWGLEALGPAMLVALEEDPYKKFEIVRCVKPEESYTKKVVTKHKYYSTYISIEDRHMISEGGLKYFPYVVPRWTKLTNQDYGRSPAWAALADMNMLQGMDMSILELIQKISDPMKLVSDDGVSFPIVNEPGGEIYGGLDAITGRPRVQFLEQGGNIQWAEGTLRRKQEGVRRLFFNNSLNGQDLPRMTAEEASIRNQENLQLILPNVHRFKMEALQRILEITYELMEEEGEFEELDPEVAAFLKGEKITLEFTGPLARTAKIQETTAFTRLLNTVLLPMGQVMQLDPEIKDNLNIQKIIKENAENMGMPIRQLNSPEEVAALKQERAEQQRIATQQALAAQADQANANATRAGIEPNGQ